MTVQKTHERDVNEYSMHQIISTLENIANQSLNMIEPKTVEQGKDNLKGLKVLVESACAFYNIK